MAPEQINDLPVTRATDIFATGVLLWELLTGRRLFQGETQAATLKKVLDAPIEPPSSVAPDISPALDAVVLRATRRAPAERYETAREMAVALEACEGVASTTRVGEWVESLAQATLSARAQVLETIEKAEIDPQSSVSEAPGVLAARAPASAESSQSTTLSRPLVGSQGRRRRTVTWIAMTAGVLGVSAAVVLTRGMAASANRATAKGVPSDPNFYARARDRDQPASASTESPSPSAPQTVPQQKPEPAVSAVAATGPAISRTAPRSPPRPPAPVASNAAAKPSTSDCDPPYTIDSEGHRHYKRQCLQ
jgi:serine/threonine-protein kinase